ncbi:uncharacterized protein BO66DRAFT_396510 [Aspergillus aculeatinus CBS 121060]|uniref:Uncharacterized protein n=1 Tax=Aspergillus aculeatinus CBS 121060 TaxID=1448322 RepID=A0ACD1GRR9_9EURO|nr:hypothetical protein BO66DRAFT_396510 [Aspergillus aculeatinus CBS 121060]RAH64024.1 hypothetical protein BO66DRAFT_396510 [Aspergillus aculeatinus CBS 121060]
MARDSGRRLRSRESSEKADYKMNVWIYVEFGTRSRNDWLLMYICGMMWACVVAWTS